MRPVALLAAAVPVAGVGAYAAVVHHVGAPRLPITCVAPDFASRWWVPGNGPAGISSAAEVHWAGSTELVGCSNTLTATVGTVPHQGLPESLLDRFVFGTHEHNLMGALTGLWDQPDGKWAYLALLLLVVFVVARFRRAAT